MISTTFNGEAVYLLPYRPDWNTKPQFTPSILTCEQQALQGVQARRAFSSQLRSEFSFSLYLMGSDNAQFRIGLQSLLNKRILCPFWPSAHYHYNGDAIYFDSMVYVSGAGEAYTSGSGEAPWFSSGLWFSFEPGMSSWEVHTTDAPTSFTPSAYAIRVPLMLGYFKQPPSPKATTSNQLSIPISFVEAGPADYALRPLADDGPAGLPLSTGLTPRIFPFVPNWATNPAAGQATIEVTRQQIGFGRELAETYYPQYAVRALDLTFTHTTWQQVAQLLAFFAARQGTVESFWLPGALDECALVAPTSVSSAQIQVNHAADLGLNRFIAFVSSRAVLEIRAVIGVNLSTNVLTLDQAPAAVYQPGVTRITSAILCRFRAPQLQLAFTTDFVAEATLNFVETPNEYQPQNGETIGVTSGALPRKACLYRFLRKLPGGTIIDRFTSYETALVAAGETFAKAKISHDQIIDSLNPEESLVNLKSEAFVGNPLMLLMPNQLEVPLELQILECTPDAAGTATAVRLRFYGLVGSPTFAGPILSVVVKGLGQRYNRLAPTVLKMKTCPWSIYSTPCGVSRATYTRTATLVSQTSNQLVLSSLSGAAPAANFFAGGKLWFGSGATYQARTVNASTVINAGQLILTLNRPLAPLSAGSVSLVPGCNRTIADCNKFSNYARFGGCPFTPVGNPSLIDQSQGQQTAGKK